MTEIVIKEYPAVEARKYIPVDHPTEKIKVGNSFRCEFMANITICNKDFNIDLYSRYSYFMNSVLFNITFFKCKLNTISFMNAYIINCRFIDCELCDTEFMNANIINTLFIECDNGHPDFKNVDFLDTKHPRVTKYDTCNEFYLYNDYTYYTKYNVKNKAYNLFEIRMFEKIVKMKLLKPANLKYIPSEKLSESFNHVSDVDIILNEIKDHKPIGDLDLYMITLVICVAVIVILVAIFVVL